MRFRPYPEYRDSGVEWLGRIPVHWQARRLKTLFSLANGATPESEEPVFWNGNIPWVTPEDLGQLTSREINDSARRITQAGYESCGVTMVPQGSLVVSTRAPIGHVGIAGVGLCTNQGCKSLVRRRAAEPKYYFYQLRAAQPVLESLGQGSTFRELAGAKLSQLSVGEPGNEEQGTIAAFLDRESARIDALVAKNERLIELLEEKRSTLVTQTVSKGLDPTVPMKDSGVEWLGEIPAHWEVERNRWLFTESAVRSRQGEEELLTVSHITGVTRRSEKPDVTMIEAESHEGYKVCRPGELAINTMWAWMGALGTAGELGMVSPSYNVFRIADPRLDPEYYDYVCRIPNHVTEIIRHSKGIWQSRLRLYPDAFREMVSPVPPQAEQRRIVVFLDRHSSMSDDLVARVRVAIARLEEYRAALISAVVTGKIDVRGDAA